MQFTSSILALASASMVYALPIAAPQDVNPTDNVDVHAGDNGRVDWHSTDQNNRMVHCTPAIGHDAVPDIELPAGQTVTSYFPMKWIGNCWGVIEGNANTGSGMLAEFNFNDWNDFTYFDVSAIVVPTDINNVYAMAPAQGDTPMSGCWNGVAPGTCDDNIYVNPDDVQTKVTQQNHLEVYLGPDGTTNNVTAKRAMTKRGVAVDRTFVIGQ